MTVDFLLTFTISTLYYSNNCKKKDNSDCVFLKDGINEFISNNLHTKIFLELSELKYKGMITYSGFVEPLLHHRQSF